MSFYMDSWAFTKGAIFHEQQVLWGFSEKENRENIVAEIFSGKISNKQTYKSQIRWDLMLMEICYSVYQK